MGFDQFAVLVGRVLLGALDVDGTIVFHPQALGALHAAAAGIGAGRSAVVREDDGFAVGALDHGGDDVALIDLLLGDFIIRAMLVEPCLQAGGLGGHGNQADHAVAAVDVQILGDGAQLMGGIQLAVALEEVILTVMAVDVAVADFLAQVVLIAALAVNQFAEHALADHVQKSQLHLVVAAVFQQHAGDAGFLAGTDHAPAFLNGGGAAYFHRNPLAGAHGGNADVDMRGPAGHNNDCIDIIAGDDALVVGVAFGQEALNFAGFLLGQLDAVLVYVADHADFNVGHLQQGLHLTASASAQTDDCQIDGTSGFTHFHNGYILP